MIFHYNYQLKLKKISRLVNVKNFSILDFGCGIGFWSSDTTKSKNLKKIIFYDKNKELIPLLKKKYNGKKIKIKFNYNQILKENYNLIVMSSVIQYMSPKKLKILLNALTKNKRKIAIVILDIPFLPRFLEFILMPLFNARRFLYVFSLLFSQKYKKLNYYFYYKKDFKTFEKKFKLSFVTNLHDLKFLRYTAILEKND